MRFPYNLIPLKIIAISNYVANSFRIASEKKFDTLSLQTANFYCFQKSNRITNYHYFCPCSPTKILLFIEVNVILLCEEQKIVHPRTGACTYILVLLFTWYLVMSSKAIDVDRAIDAAIMKEELRTKIHELSNTLEELKQKANVLAHLLLPVEMKIPYHLQVISNKYGR